MALCFLSFFVLFNDANAIMSQDGIIQNVQTYSSNPFWQMGTNSYNQRMPTPVFATGTAIETSKCQSIVASLVIDQCSRNNNCRSTQLSDIRPPIMLQLSQIPNGNYATACAGYIDSAFDKYKKEYANSVPITPTTFPVATTANPIATQPSIQIENPYKSKAPDWQTELMERKLELQQLQAANGAGNTGLERATFPTSASDLSYAQRIENAAAGYEPYADKSAFVPIEIEDEQDYLARKNKKAEEHDLLNLLLEEFCKKYPNNPKCEDDNNELPVHPGEIPVDIT